MNEKENSWTETDLQHQSIYVELLWGHPDTLLARHSYLPTLNQPNFVEAPGVQSYHPNVPINPIYSTSLSYAFHLHLISADLGRIPNTSLPSLVLSQSTFKGLRYGLTDIPTDQVAVDAPQ